MNNDNRILLKALESGIIDLDFLCSKVEMVERQQFLNKHSFKIWQGKDGFFYTYLPDESKKEKRCKVKKKSQADIENAVIDFYKKQETKVKFKDCLDEWAAQKLAFNEIEKQTYDRYFTDYTRFFKNQYIDSIEIKYITEEVLEDFIKTAIRDNNLTSKGYGNLRTIIRGTMQFAKKQGYTDLSVSTFFGDLNLSKKAFRHRQFTDEESVFTETEENKIKEWINEVEPSLINYGIYLAFLTGLRAGELSALQRSDFDGYVLHVTKTEIRYKDEAGHYVFEVREYTKGKVGRRNVVLTDEALQIAQKIFRMNPQGEYLFEDNGRRIKGKAFTVKIEKICKYLGIPPRSLHKARKTYATKLLESKVDESLIIKQMGHTDISTTKGFYYFNRRNEQEVRQILNEVR